MLKSLKNLSAEDADRLLIEVVQRLLPHPEPREDALMSEPRTVEVLNELWARIGAEPEDYSHSSRTKLFELLVKEMSSPVLTGRRRHEAQRRLGARGDLRPDLYQIRFRDEFRIEELRGIRRGHVESAIRQPDAIQHISVVDVEETQALTFVSKRVDDPDSRNTFVLLVQAMREMDTLVVLKAWRVYYSDVDLSSASTPLEIFVAFVEHYGVTFNFASVGPTKYILNQGISIVGGMGVPQIDPISVGDHHTEAFRMLRPSRITDAMFVIAAYMIDSEKYFDDLRRHKGDFSPEYPTFTLHERTVY